MPYRRRTIYRVLQLCLNSKNLFVQLLSVSNCYCYCYCFSTYFSFSFFPFRVTLPNFHHFSETHTPLFFWFSMSQLLAPRGTGPHLGTIMFQLPHDYFRAKRRSNIPDIYQPYSWIVRMHGSLRHDGSYRMSPCRRISSEMVLQNKWSILRESPECTHQLWLPHAWCSWYSIPLFGWYLGPIY